MLTKLKVNIFIFYLFKTIDALDQWEDLTDVGKYVVIAHYITLITVSPFRFCLILLQ